MNQIQSLIEVCSNNLQVLRLKIKSELVQVMAWCLLGTKPLPELMITQFNDTHLIPGYRRLMTLWYCGYVLLSNIVYKRYPLLTYRWLFLSVILMDSLWMTQMLRCHLSYNVHETRHWWNISSTALFQLSSSPIYQTGPSHQPYD